MAYSALEKMRRKNRRLYGFESVGPKQPELRKVPADQMDLKAAAVQFLYERCEGLRLEEADPADPDGLMTRKETEAGNCLGTSAGPGQIPVNMQRDLDRLCLQRAVERFLDSGAFHDAFDVYFCYLEMFFGGYGQSRRMIELLSEFESNSSALLMTHRDHYSHSVYVFTLGLAIYETSKRYRDAYQKFYGLPDDHRAACHYLKYWGLTALFHDIGYPFELPYEQVNSYFSERDKESDASNGRAPENENHPYLSYSGIQGYVNLKEEEKERLFQLYGREFESTDQLFAWDIAEKLGEAYHISESALEKTIRKKPQFPDEFQSHMDHAYFSATVLFRELFEEIKPEEITKVHVDALAAILLHNSLFKFSILPGTTAAKNPEEKDEKDGGAGSDEKKEKNDPLRMDLHPLAFMLMLCDELQCWDRIAYGRNSRSELQPMGCRFLFLDDEIRATYLYDEAEKKKKDEFWEKYGAYMEKKAERPKLKNFSKMVLAKGRGQEGKAAPEFLTDIEEIVEINGNDPENPTIKFSVSTDFEKADNTGKHTFLSNSNFIHLYNFALALNAQYNNKETDEKEMTRMFSELSLEYKLSNVLQAKKFSEYLDYLGYFFTDRPVAYEMVEQFTDKQLAELGAMEHARWENEKRMMCWMPAGEMEERCREKKQTREQTRMHYDLDVDFASLPYEEQVKDMKPLNTMMKKLKEYDGLRIYQYRRKEETR